MQSYQKFTIITMQRPFKAPLNEELQWFGNSLGLISERDKDKSLFRVFIGLIKAAKQDEHVRIDELARSLGLTHGAITHHLNKLTEAGLTVHKGRKYWLRARTLAQVVDEVKKDMDRSFENIRLTAQEIDIQLGL